MPSFLERKLAERETESRDLANRAQPVRKAAARPHAAKRIGRAADLSYKTEKGHPREKLGCPFYLLVREGRSELLSPLGSACGFRS